MDGPGSSSYFPVNDGLYEAPVIRWAKQVSEVWHSITFYGHSVLDSTREREAANIDCFLYCCLFCGAWIFANDAQGFTPLLRAYKKADCPQRRIFRCRSYQFGVFLYPRMCLVVASDAQATSLGAHSCSLSHVLSTMRIQHVACAHRPLKLLTL